LAWSPDGVLLASAGGGENPAVSLWDGSTGGLIQKLEGSSASFYTVAFTPDGKLLAAAGKDGTIFLWEMADSGLFKTLEGHQGAVWGLAFSPDGQTLFSAGSDQSVRAWNFATGELLWKEDAGSRVYALALSLDGRWLAAGLEKGGVWLFDLDRKQPAPGIELESGAVNSLAFYPSYPLLAIGTDRGQVILYDLNLSQLTNEWHAHQGWVLGLAWNPDGALLASAGGEGDAQVILWGR
jgi:WD40 repeat protein